MAGHGLFIVVSSLSGVKVFYYVSFSSQFFLVFFPYSNQSVAGDGSHTGPHSRRQVLLSCD